ncbi:glycerol dehydratase reactivase beta/small subunit family protein [Amycolatopsis thermoflava]|uniref:glycerol dehydratase reactivase beta/small subunit family protein n=1 Tax=Amycolatopsis thermoflava TaxID=84480 RepID=UPI0003FC48C7|nr:glycerol dehydratase reactivase beta/small subunit family protein [Amycolatopsis thermoflava]
MRGPAVVLRCLDAKSPVLREIRAGLEEEGVPLVVEEVSGGDALVLGYAAACLSSLDVGIGVADEVCVHHAKRPAGSPALTGPLSRARVLGHNAARMVVGIPLK